MRRFEDEQGRAWEVVAGRESWGAIFAIFVPVGGDAPVRQAPLAATSYEQANVELGGASEETLRGLLARSDEKPLE